MKHNVKSIRPFIGSNNFELSRNFYRDLGFEEKVISYKMSLFKINDVAFYLQDAYLRDWIDNTMVFVEVDDVNRYWEELVALNLESKYKGVQLTPAKDFDWGRECYLHDPSGILWHFGQFF